MSSTNKTSNLELSQFIGTDSPKWLTDYNSDMQKIDAGVDAVQTQANATDLVVAGHTSSIQSNTQSISDQQTAITSLRTDVTAAKGSINTITSLIGNGEPTTTDKTIIGAINEIIASATTWTAGTLVAGTDVTTSINTLLFNDFSKIGLVDVNVKANTIDADGWIVLASFEGKIVERPTRICMYSPMGDVRDCVISATATGSEIRAFLQTTDTTKTFRVPSIFFRYL